MRSMAFCQTCGSEVGVGANFCPNRGASQNPFENPVLPTGEPLLELRTHWFMTGRPIRITSTNRESSSYALTTAK